METRIYTLRLDVENPNRIKDPKPFSNKQSIKFIVARTIQAWTLVWICFSNLGTMIIDLIIYSYHENS